MTVNAVVTFDFDLSAAGGDFFTLDDPLKGVLDNVTYRLAGDTATDVTADVRSLSVRRGRSRELDTIDAGACTISLLNLNRDYDPSYAGSPYVGNVVPGKRVQVSVDGASIYEGHIEDWNLDYTVDGLATATVVSADLFSLLARREFDTWTTTAQVSGARITAVLDRDEVGFSANRIIDAGSASLQADPVSVNSNVLNYLQLVAQSEAGWLYASSAGVLRFRGRTATLNQSGAVVFADDGTGIGYETIAFQYGSELLFNRISVDRETGIAQTAQDAASQATYGTRALSITGLLYDSDSQSSDAAYYWLNRYRTPELHVVELSLELQARTAPERASVLALDLSDVVRIVFDPPGPGAAIDRHAVVEGIAHEIGPMSHRITFSFGDADTSAFLVLDDLALGVLDSSRLAF